MLILVVVWWLFFFSAMGLCLGSFLNVVIYRLPLGLALGQPVWSFCPNCENRIVWYDNLPVVSYVWLGGRCRFCWKCISPRYPLVELMTAMIVVMLLDALFIGRLRDGLLDVPELSWRLSADWPILVAHIILFACLLGMSGIDIAHYWVDIRFTHLAVACGFVLHAIWTPDHSREWLRPLDTTAIVSLVALAGFAGAWFVVLLRSRRGAEEAEDHADDTPELHRQSTVGRRRIIIPLIVFAFLLIGAASAEIRTDAPIHVLLRFGVPLVIFFLVIMYEASHTRPSDTEIVQAIESEASSARAVALGELGFLMFAIVPGVAAFWLVTSQAGLGDRVSDILHWSPTGDWQPLWGLGTAATGYVIGAGIGWASRIVFSLLLGKEAFGTGDIHMMAAAGCVAGWQVVALGFVLTCFIALFGWLLLLPVKRTRAIPLGPWLSLSFLIVVVFYKLLIATPVVANFVSLMELLFFDDVRPWPFEVGG